MAIKTQSLTVTTTRQAIAFTDTDDTAGMQLWLYGEYHGSSNKVAFGGSDVAMTNGIHLYAGEKFGPIMLEPDETLYVVSDSVDGINLRVLARGA